MPDFPLHAFPNALADFVADVAATTNTPPDYAGCFALSVAAGAVGATRAVEVKKGHIQRSSLYICAVAQKGSGKSPALDAVATPVYERQSGYHRDKEKKKKAFVSDVTAEKLAEVLNDNPRGALMIRDELAGWLMSFNQYKAGGKGSDRQFYLSAWSGAAVSVDRKNKDADPLFVRFPCLTVVGTIQPAVFDRFRGDADDGFYDRVLFCYPDELPLVGERWGEIDDKRADRWAEAVRDLSDVPMPESDKGPHPKFLTLSGAAKGVWKEWTEWVAATCNAADFDPVLRGPAVKLSGYAARLGLVAHMLRFAYGELHLSDQLSDEDMRRGVDLATYFFGHARRAWAAVGLDGQHAATRRLLRWICDRGPEPFTRREAHRALHRVFPTSEALTQPLKDLVDNCYIRYRPASADASQLPTPGRPAAVVYEINPELCQRVTTVTASPAHGVTA